MWQGISHLFYDPRPDPTRISATMARTELPIEVLREELLAAAARGPVVVTAATGTGKSTQVPRWLGTLGRVLVIEPRRIACQSLAARVAELEGSALGDTVGYVVRDDRRAGAGTRVQFVTPGVALRMFADDGLAGFEHVVLDEFHERGLDVDLLLALILRAGRPSPVVMSATVGGARLSRHLGAAHLHHDGTAYPVRVHYLPGETPGPSAERLEERVVAALEHAISDADVDGDVLVFLPGKGEIERARRAIDSRASLSGLEILSLHGGLDLGAQKRAFAPGSSRRVVLATNVAETSITLPRIGVVIDSGLVRRTHYRAGRGHLRLTSIAADSAGQRTGRAGRLGPGSCYRLWAGGIALDETTPPEIRRESLVPLLLSAAACGAADLELPFLDAPKPYAVDAAREVLQDLDALDASGALTDRGARLFALPIDVALGRALVEAERTGTLPAMLALCATLAVDRMTRVVGDGEREHPPCDATARIDSVAGRPSEIGWDRLASDEIARTHSRLRALWPDAPPVDGSLDRRALAQTLLAAWPGCAHVARRRRGRVAWSNGGTELELARESIVDPERTDALLVLDTRAIGRSRTRSTLLITAAMPVPLEWLRAAGLGRERLRDVRFKEGRLVARIERVYARKVIGSREESPTGALARTAIRDLVLDGGLFPDALPALRERHERRELALALEGSGGGLGLEEWLSERLEALGVESGDDIALLESADLLPDALPIDQAERLARSHPHKLSIGDATYRIAYDVPGRTATLHQIAGTRKTPPGSDYLPRLPGWRLDWEYKNRVRPLRRP